MRSYIILMLILFSHCTNMHSVLSLYQYWVCTPSGKALILSSLIAPMLILFLHVLVVAFTPLSIHVIIDVILMLFVFCRVKIKKLFGRTVNKVKSVADQGTTFLLLMFLWSCLSTHIYSMSTWLCQFFHVCLLAFDWSYLLGYICFCLLCSTCLVMPGLLCMFHHVLLF